MKRRLGFVLLILILGPSVWTVVAQTARDTLGRVRILFIGNSYTYVNDLPRLLQFMALRRPEPVALEIGSILVGGATLQRHWRDSATIAQIRRGNWDRVVLQEQSLMPIQAVDTFLTYGSRLIAEIRAINAKPLLYLTWSRKHRPSSQDSLTDAYLHLATAMAAEIVPVGLAWQQFRQLAPSIDLYLPDGSHPSPIGTYIAAAAFYRFLFGCLPDPDHAFTFITLHNSGALERTAPLKLSAEIAKTVHEAVVNAFSALQDSRAKFK